MPASDLDATARMTPGGIDSVDSRPASVATPICFPLEIQFGGLLDRGLFFRHPLQVRLDKTEGSYVAECPQLDQFGYGSSVAEALDDLGKTLSEMYFYLSDGEHSGTLGESLSTQYDILRGFIGSRAPGALTA